MYATLICFLFTAFVFFIFGKSFIQFIEKDKQKNYTVFDSYFVGLSIVGTFLNFWSLFFPTNYISFCILLLVSFFLAYKEREKYRLYFIHLKNKISHNKLLLILILFCVIIVLFFSIVTPQLYDSYLYHINAIQWNEKYRIVPGLANLHDRFGFNSSVFVLSACFSFKFIYEQSFFIINSLSYLFFLIWILKLVINLKSIKSIFLLLFIYYFTNQYLLDISSPGTDLLPNIFLSYILINSILFTDFIYKKIIVLIAMPLFCITLKVSTIPIVLFTLLALFSQKEKTYFKSTLNFIYFGSLFILPWIVRNIMITGYILFPMTSIDVFDFDWKVPIENVNILKKWVYSWARIPFKNYTEVMNLNFIEWFSVWWKNALLINKRIYILSIISPLIFVAYSIIKKGSIKKLISILVALIIMLLWFFTAPDVRFVFAVLLFLAFSPVLLLNFPKNYMIKLKPIIYICSIITLFLISEKAYSLFEEDYKHKKIIDYSYLPIDVSTVKEKRNIQFNRIPFQTNSNTIYLFEPNPRNAQCYDKFPCSWYIDGSLKLRGDELSDGFYHSK